MHGHIAGVHGGLHGVFGEYISSKTLTPHRVGADYIKRTQLTPESMNARGTIGGSAPAFVDWALQSPEAATQRVLIDPSAVESESSSDWLWWLIGGGAALALVGGGVYVLQRKPTRSKS
jgi:hypothetical protein